MVLGFLKGLLGGSGGASDAPDGDPVEYEGFTIVPAPVRDGSTWRVAGRVSREVDGEVRTHEFVRADTFPDRDTAIETALFKARRIVDERGMRLFDD